MNPALLVLLFDLQEFKSKTNYLLSVERSKLECKFGYLRELLDLKVRVQIDGLLITMEGYERAENILSSKHRKISKIVNTYIQNNMNLPVITTTQPSRVHEF